MMKGLIIDHDNMSNLTFASGEISASSTTRNELSTIANNNNNINTSHLYPPPQLSSASTTTHHSAPPPHPPPPKKKRNLPGNPDPEAEVIALSPKTLLATNRFICEICNKGFQRDQNLQLHRRGHNLPWKLKQRANKEVIRKKVYVCPEATCVHHDPSRALGDLTGIKKHFFRKHGEKKWKCDKCSKRYAVQSDWKAHSKICGTREYRCDCGTLFSRRDSFITHRAFCDALAQESTSTTNITARAMTALNNNNNPLLFSSSSSLSSSSQLVLQSQLDSQLYGLSSLVKREQQDAVNVVPQWLMSPTLNLPSQPPLFSTSHNPSGALDHSFMQELSQKPNPSSGSAAPIINMNPIQQQQPSAFASATALLQKAAQMGATMSVTTNTNNNNNNNRSSSSSSSSPFLGSSSIGVMPNAAISGGQMILMEDPNALGLHYDMMTSFGDGGGNNNNGYLEEQAAPASGTSANNNPEAQLRSVVVGGNNNDGMTRDFLGLRTFPRREFFSMVGLDHHHHLNSSATAFSDHHQQKNHDHDHHQTPWHGIDGSSKY